MSLTQEEIFAEFCAAVEKAGGVVAFSKGLGIAHPSVSSAVRKLRKPSETMLNAAGIISRTTYHRISDV